MKCRLPAWSFFLVILFSPLASNAKEPVWTAKPGPWGQLEVRAVYLEPPDSLLAVIAKPNSITHWSFEQTTEQGVRELLTKVGVSAPIVGRLFASGRTLVGGNSVSLYPQVEDLTALSTEVRSALYGELAKYPANEYQRDPVYILGGDVDDWLAEVPLSSAQQQLFRSLLWKRGDALVFSDMQALLTLCHGPEEVGNVFRTMTRVRSLVVELQLPLKSDRKEFLEYWAAGQTDAPRLTFINAITQRRAPQTVDITHFLPSLMRQRAYTFPEMELGLKGRFPDCHWTSLNFFNITPKEFFLDTRLAAEHLLANYTTVEAPYRFGDVLCFLDNGQGLHTCVFIADDIVLTKNGDSILAPWVMMQIKDVESVYRRSASTRIQGYRQKK